MTTEKRMSASTLMQAMAENPSTITCDGLEERGEKSIEDRDREAGQAMSTKLHKAGGFPIVGKTRDDENVRKRRRREAKKRSDQVLVDSASSDSSVSEVGESAQAPIRSATRMTPNELFELQTATPLTRAPLEPKKIRVYPPRMRSDPLAETEIVSSTPIEAMRQKTAESMADVSQQLTFQQTMPRHLIVSSEIRNGRVASTAQTIHPRLDDALQQRINDQRKRLALLQGPQWDDSDDDGAPNDNNDDGDDVGEDRLNARKKRREKHSSIKKTISASLQTVVSDVTRQILRKLDETETQIASLEQLFASRALVERQTQDLLKQAEFLLSPEAPKKN